jgi:3-isopropylmalate/(R)-2-methylmalate dehydratase small subunit
VALPAADVDTDQIIPARYLKTTESTGLGERLFADWRYGPDGAPRSEFPLNRPEARGAAILLTGPNFGCGSSREHAPWALHGFGFRALVGPSFADIFTQNALKNGVLPVVVDAATHARLLALAARDPRLTLTIDLATQTLALPDGTAISFPVDAFAKECLLRGIDELGYLLGLEERIAAHEASHARS